MWNSEYKWHFGRQDNPEGFNNGGVSEFRSIKYDGLAREIIQNSLDARRDEDKPVVVKFEHLKVNNGELPNYKDLLISVKECYEYIEKEESNNRNLKDLEHIKKCLLESLKENETTNVLKIGDFNTLGLSMKNDKDEYNEKSGTAWANLVKKAGNSYKKNGDGGSFGIGKFAPFVFSTIRTLIYSTKTVDGDIAVQGKTILSGRIENGVGREPIGFYGQYYENKYGDETIRESNAIKKKENIPITFLRDEIGTNVFVLNAKIENDWDSQILVSVLKSFFFAIINNSLEVEIKKYDEDNPIIINSKTILGLVNKYSDLNYDIKTTQEYINVLNDDKIQTFEKEFELLNGNKGTMKLKIMTKDKSASKSIAHIRKTGMLIEESTIKRMPISYIGINITNNDEMNAFLRECEAPKHDAWSSSNFTEDENKAKKILTEIKDWEKEIIKSLYQMPQNEKIDPFGMADFLPYEEDEKKQEKEFETSLPSNIPIEPKIKKVIDSKRTQKAKINVGIEIVETGEGIFEGTSSSNNNGKGNAGIIGNGKGGATEQIKNGLKQEKIKVPIKNVRTPYLNKVGTYRIVFTPEETKNDATLHIRRVDSSMEAEVVNIKNIKLKERDKYIEIKSLNLIKDKSVILEVELENVDREILEVSLYVKE